MDYKTVLKPAVISTVLMTIISSVFRYMARYIDLGFLWTFNVSYICYLLFVFFTGFLALYLFIRTKGMLTTNNFIMLVLITDLLYLLFADTIFFFQFYLSDYSNGVRLDLLETLVSDVYSFVFYIFLISLGAKTAVKMVLPPEKRRLNIAPDANLSELHLWALAFFFPEEAFRYAKTKASYSQAIRNYLVPGLVIIVIGVILLTYNLTKGAPASLFIEGIIILIVSSVSMVISSFILSAIIFVISLILGGKGRFVVQTYLLSLFVFFNVFAIIVIGFSMFFGGYFYNSGNFTAILLIIGYYIYMTSSALKETHGYSTLKSILSQPVIYYSILVIIAVIISLR
jgi:hypothetical protein